jgi:hypothetical protein
MEGQNLDPGNQLWHFKQMKKMEFHISTFGNRMQRIIVVEDTKLIVTWYATINFLI